MNAHRLDPERIILGCWTMFPELLDRRRIEPEYFSQEYHREYASYLVALRLAGRFNEPEDAVWTLYHDEAASLRCGGDGYWTNHGEHVGTFEAYPHYERMLLEDVKRRCLLAAGAALTEGASSGLDPDAVERETRARLDFLAVGQPVTESADLAGLGVWAAFDEESSGRRDPFLRTGWRAWDEHSEWQGWSSEGVTLLLARSGIGKTSLVNSSAILMAAAGRHVYVHGTETSRAGRLATMALGIASVDPRRWAYLCRLGKEGRLHQRGLEELEALASRLRQATDWLRTLPLHLSGAGLTVERVRAEALRLRAAGCLDVVIADYLQDFQPSKGIPAGEKGQQTSHASRVLKDLAAEARVPVLVTAQVSGEKETGSAPPSDPSPQMWDCQWSSAAHQDAEEVFALNRGDYWQARLKSAYNPTKHGPLGVLEVTARKKRTGSLSTLHLAWDGVHRWVGEHPGSDPPPETTLPTRRDEPDWHDAERGEA